MKGSPAVRPRRWPTAAAAAGRPITAVTLDGPAHWNPLAHGNATELKDKLMATERFTEPHYQRAAERYVQTVLQVLRTRRSGSARRPSLRSSTLMDPRRLPPSPCATSTEPLRERMQDYLAGLTPDQLSAVRGLQTRLAVLTESHTGAVPGAGRRSARRRRSTCARRCRRRDVVAVQPELEQYGKLAAQLGTLVVQDLVAASGDRLDDAARGRALGRRRSGSTSSRRSGADHVIALLARGRESGTSRPRSPPRSSPTSTGPPPGCATRYSA